MFPYRISYGVLARPPMFPVAWFTATTQTINVVGNKVAKEDIGVSQHASVDPIDLRLGVTWPATFPLCDLTAGVDAAGSADNVAQVVGGAYVLDGNGHIKENKSAQLVKAVQVDFTFDPSNIDHKRADGTWEDATEADIDQLNNTKYNVYVKGTGNIRVNTELLSSGAGSGAVGATASFTGVEILVGRIEVSVTGHAASFTYTPIMSVTNKLSFYYSVTPKAADTTANAENTTGDYGDIEVITQEWTSPN